MDYKYQQALERASKLRVQNPFDTVSQMVEHIFPELKEKTNTDERIRKGLVKAVSGILKGNTLYGTDVTREEALTWLETQKHEEPEEVVFRPIAGYSIDIAAIQAIEKQRVTGKNIVLAFNGAYIPVDSKTSDEIVAEYNHWIIKQSEKTNPYSGISFEYNGHTWGMCARDNGVDILLDKQLFKHLDTQGENESDFSDIRIWKYVVDAVLTEENGIGQYLDKLDTERIAKKLQKRFGNIEKQDESDETTAKRFLINKGYPIDANGIFPTFEEMYNIIRDGFEYQDEQEHIDKPKFNIDDWIVGNDGIFKITQYEDEYGYELTDINGCVVHFVSPDYVESNFHRWTIADAKDGDVLVTPPEEGSESNEQIFLFKAINSRDYVDNCIEYYGRLCDDRFYKNKTGYMGIILDTFYPATKEQRVLFFQKMKEANYVWNVYNKELTKIEQKPADKIESKFHEGDLIVINETTYQIAEIDNSHVVLSLNGRECNFGLDVLDNAHFWTIEDAKDGDVLVCNINKAEIGGDVEKLPNMTPTICIYQNVVKDSEYIHSYCSLYDENSLVLQNTMYYNAFVYNIHPATKEQRDLLFQKMAEAGYEWDSENKELKKIEYKFNVDDWIVTDDSFGKIVRHIDEICFNLIDKRYVASDENGLIYNISFSNENKWHKWTIADAKDGDILMTTAIRNCPFIYRKTDYNNDLAYYYVGVDGNGNFCEGCLKRTLTHFGPVENVVPATKEQRDLLFQKMAKAGYEWNSENKELKKIEPKILDADDVLPYLGNNQVQDILEDMGMLDDNGRCPHTAEEIFKAGMEHAFNLNREAVSKCKN